MAAQKMETRVYHPLNADDFTRLVVLEPGAYEDPLCCSLRPISHQDHSSDPVAAEYSALSYVWGTSNLRSQITCNGQISFITQNLDQALRRFRQTEEQQTLWVDAICINQSDPVERSSQVQRMKSIYQRAREVLVWLGDEGEDTELVVRLLDAHKRKAHEPWFHVRTQFGKDAPEWAAMIRWLNRPWFWRVWTIQEARLARKAVLHFGSHCVDLNIVDSVMSLHVSRDLNYDLAGHLEEAFRLPGLSVRLGGSIQRGTGGGAPRLIDLLLLARRHQATDPRDKIFALLGLAEDLSEQEKEHAAIRPDYQKSMAMVYTDAALFIVAKYRSLTVVQAVYHGDEFLPSQELPSWVPRWDQETGPSMLGERSYRRMLPAKGGSILERSPKNGILAVSGTRVTTVSATLAKMDQSQLTASRQQGCATIFDELWSTLRDHMGSPRYVNSRPLILVFIEAMTIGLNGRGEYFHCCFEDFFTTMYWLWGHVPDRPEDLYEGPRDEDEGTDSTDTPDTNKFEEKSDSNENNFVNISPHDFGDRHESDMDSEALSWPLQYSRLESKSEYDSDSPHECTSRGSSRDTKPRVDKTTSSPHSSSRSTSSLPTFTPGICALCNEAPLSTSLHSYLTNSPNLEELPESDDKHETFAYRINDFFEYHLRRTANFPGPSLSFLAPCIDACNLRRMFITKNNSFGLGPLAMREGDSIVTVRGATYPWVLRSVDVRVGSTDLEKGEEEKGDWHFIGECYLQGFDHEDDDKDEDSSEDNDYVSELEKFLVV